MFNLHKQQINMNARLGVLKIFLWQTIVFSFLTLPIKFCEKYDLRLLNPTCGKITFCISIVNEAYSITTKMNSFKIGILSKKVGYSCLQYMQPFKISNATEKKFKQELLTI